MFWKSFFFFLPESFAAIPYKPLTGGYFQSTWQTGMPKFISKITAVQFCHHREQLKKLEQFWLVIKIWHTFLGGNKCYSFLLGHKGPALTTAEGGHGCTQPTSGPCGFVVWSHPDISSGVMRRKMGLGRTLRADGIKLQPCSPPPHSHLFRDFKECLMHVLWARNDECGARLGWWAGDE